MRQTRGSFLRRAAVAATAAAAFPATATARSHGGDAAILGRLLQLERLKAAFYRDADERGFVFGEELAFAKASRTHDEAHAGALADAIDDLGGTLPRPLAYGFRGVTADPARFRQVAEALEETAVGAYVGQADAIRSHELRFTLAQILGVEAGQLAWIRELLAPGVGPYAVPDAFAASLTPEQVDAIVDSTGFIRS